MKPAYLKNSFTKLLRSSRSGFTLLELIIVIGIVAILGTVSVIVLNPAQMFKQTRDTNRISDLQSVNNALLYYQAAGGTSFGSHTVIYVSLPDTSPTCDNLGLPAPGAGYTYSCKTAANYRNVNGTGWIPVDFTTAQGTVGTLFSTLPIDPVNTVSGDYYYTYIFGTWTLSATLESVKYLASNATGDGGAVSTRFEVGNDLALNSNITAGGGTAVCGNNIREGSEVCDGTDLNSQTCATQAGSGYTGTLSCNVGCTAFVTSSCVAPPAIGTMTTYTGTGANPFNIALNTATGDMWTANVGGNSVSKITPTGTMTTYTGTGAGPRGIAFNSTTGDMWTANDDGASVSKVTSAGVITNYSGGLSYPRGIAFNSTTGDMWVTNYSGNSVTKVTSAGTMTTYTGTGTSPDSIAFNTVTGDMWTGNSGANSVTKVTPTGTMTTYTGTGAQPESIAFNSVTGDMWTANYGNNSVSKITSAGTVTTYTGTGTNPRGITFDGTNMWTANNGNASVTKVTPTGTMTTYTGTGAGPDDIAFDGTNMWTANFNSNSVTKIRAL